MFIISYVNVVDLLIWPPEQNINVIIFSQGDLMYAVVSKTIWKRAALTGPSDLLSFNEEVLINKLTSVNEEVIAETTVYTCHICVIHQIVDTL